MEGTKLHLPDTDGDRAMMREAEIKTYLFPHSSPSPEGRGGKSGEGETKSREYNAGVHRKSLSGGQGGFTLIELLVTIVISLFAIAATTSLFGQLFAQFKQESRVSQTDIGSAIGLQYLQKDIQGAGYGLPWNLGGLNYNEYSGTGNALNGNDAPAGAPRAIFSIPNAGVNNSDYLVIKSQSTGFASDSAAGKFSILNSTGPKQWGQPTPDLNYDFSPSDNVIVESTSNGTPSLVTSGGSFYALYNGVTAFAPTGPRQTYMIYGIADAANAPHGLRMPFNRADYFITPHDGIVPAAGNCPAQTVPVPSRCAPGTGELVKAVLQPDSQTGGCFTYYPILDCVGDMKVEFDLYVNNADVLSNDIYTNPLSASQIRQQVKEVRVFILAQEGQKDPSYKYPANLNPIFLGDPGVGANYTLDLTNDANSQLNYRWKVYTIIEKPMNLGQ